MDDEALLREFEARTLPFTHWRHTTHIRIAWLYLTRHPWAEALRLTRQGIQAYNAANNVPDSVTSGYHETTTVAWLRIVADAIARYGPGENSLAFLDAQPHLAQRTLLRVHYTKERFTTPLAKAGYVAPDLAQLPAPPRAGNGLALGDRQDIDWLHNLTPGALSNEVTRRRFTQAADEGGLYIWSEAGTIYGYGVMERSFFECAYIAMLFVSPETRRRGLATHLMQAMMRGRFTPKLFTSTNASNEPMHALLQKLGFKRCGEVDELDPGDPEVFYVHEEKA